MGVSFRQAVELEAMVSNSLMLLFLLVLYINGQRLTPFPGQHCSGGRQCCTLQRPCGVGEGGCDGSTGCKGDLVCGINNCKKFGHYYEVKDDCCDYPSSENQSGEEEYALFIGPYLSYQPEIILVPSMEHLDCSIPAFPAELSDYEMSIGPRGFDICGGYDEALPSGRSGQSSECFHLPYKSSAWLRGPTIPKMNEKRWWFSSARLGDEWFVTGSYNRGNPLQTSEVRGLNDIWKKSVNLPGPNSRHCMVTLDANRILLTGGDDESSNWLN